MKIAILIRNYQRNSGGAERYCVELTERISKLHEVHVFAQKYDITSKLITFHKIPQLLEKPRFINQLMFSWFTKRATFEQFDIVHSHELVSHANIYTIHVPLFKSILTNVNGFKKLLRVINTALSIRKISYLWLENKQMEHSSKRYFISVSEYLSRNIEQCYPLIKNIFVAHPGVSEKFFQNVPFKDVQLRNLRRELSIPSNSFLMLLVANNFQKKGLPTIVKSLDLLKNNKIHLVIAGNDKKKITYIPKSISHQIHFLGLINDMVNLYDQVDLLLHPTLADTFGMAPLEAMSRKLPVIISNIKYCGLSEHLNDSQALILNNPKDEIELASKINFLYENTDERNRIIQNGFELSTTINWDNTLHKTLVAYNSITN